jgi:hypothetical protein
MSERSATGDQRPGSEERPTLSKSERVGHPRSLSEVCATRQSFFIP